MSNGEYCLLPMQTIGYPRCLLPVQSFRRAVPLLLLVVTIVLVIGSLMKSRDIIVYVFAFLVAMSSALGWIRLLLLPKSLIIRGINAKPIVNEIIYLIEKPSLGFRYRCSVPGVWTLNGPDIYPWDPSIRISWSENEASIVGPGVTIKLIAQRVICS